MLIFQLSIIITPVMQCYAVPKPNCPNIGMLSIKSLLLLRLYSSASKKLIELRKVFAVNVIFLIFKPIIIFFDSLFQCPRLRVAHEF